ncbi:MAG: C-terminal target protein [Ignavibacteria bacterium]|nr:C-terminal target protein [Ignavibacteria bacterium]
MKRYFLQNKVIRLLFGLLLLSAIFLVEIETTNAQQLPQVPVLSLTGENDTYNKEIYPDGRIWLPASINGPREFLLPVYVENRWYTYNEASLIANPIYSFEFSVVYDSTAIRATGVQPFGDARLDHTPLASNFSMAWYDERDLTYKEYLDPGTTQAENEKGRAIRIVGTATSNALPNTDLSAQDFKVLLYVKFRIVATGVGAGLFTPIYISPKLIKYNDCNIRTTHPFEKSTVGPYYGLGKIVDPGANIIYYSTNPYIGMGGIDNSTRSRYATEPTLPGSIYLRFETTLPQFEFVINRGKGQIPAVKKIPTAPEYEIWEISDPITVDSGSVTPLWGSRVVQLRNSVSRSRLTDIEIESDQPWLWFRTRSYGTGTKNPIPTSTRADYINYIDNGILGDYQDPMDIPTVADGDVFLEVQCNPTYLDNATEYEHAGIYVGYLTFKSDAAAITPVKLKVTFIYFRNPREGAIGGRLPGIELTVMNSAPVPDVTTLVFGTGFKASNGVDSLFGEYAYDSPLQNFGARWYWHSSMNPKEVQADHKVYLEQNGFGDFSSSEDVPHSSSRDIRSNMDTLKSLIYYCKFNAGGPDKYPVVLEWDVTDFIIMEKQIQIEGGKFTIKDAVNGGLFHVDMRNANPKGPNKMTYTIEDAKYSEFIIEYTLPNIIKFVDGYGNPIIKSGWNLLSLPRAPVNTNWKAIYKNAINIPVTFAKLWQQAPVLTPGVGYWVRYPDNIVDVSFSGAYIDQINAVVYPTLLYTGWNTVGSCSGPVNVKDIDLIPFNSSDPPDINETKKKGVFRYVTGIGYKEVSEMSPGLGYWMYVNKGGYLKMEVDLSNIGNSKMNAQVEDNYTKTNIFTNSTQLTVRDNSSNEGTVYLTTNNNVNVNAFELPPPPPFDLFDIRFNNNIGTSLDNSSEPLLKLQGVTYPVSLAIEKADAKYTFVDAVSGQVFGSVNKGETGNIEIGSTKSNTIKILKTEISTDLQISCKPNPIVTESNLSYSIPVSGNVTITLYDALGIQVSTLLNDYRRAGEYNDIKVSSANLTAGQYFCKIVSGGNTVISTLNIIR